MNRHQIGAALVGAGLVMGLSCGAALAATPRFATSSASATSTKPNGSTTSTTATTVPAGSAQVPAVFAGDVQAFGMRIEADEPLPVGPGDIPSVSGQVNAQEDFSTATSAVDLMGAVVGPKVADPDGDGHQYTQLPQATCLYPSDPNTDAQSYPFDGSDQQTAQSETTCGEGPSATGLAYAGQAGGNAGITNPTELGNLGLTGLPVGVEGVAAAHESLGPDTTTGSVLVSADAELDDFNIPGVLHVAHVEATGYSEASGLPGGAATSASVTLSGLTIGGSTISITPAGVSIGNQPPVPVSADGPVVAEFNQAASAVGCNLTVLSNPSTYPQGPLFERPPLPNRVNPNGTDAGSTGAGALVRCAIPASINTTNFAPLIVQIVFGFVGTEADATATTSDAPSVTGSSYSPPTAVSSPSVSASAVASGSNPVQPAASGNAVTSTVTATAPSAGPATAVHASGNPLSVAVRPVAVVGGLVPLRGTLEMSGLALALLIALAGITMVAPWRVTLAPVDHPEV